SLLVSIAMSITTTKNRPGWIPNDLNKGHLDKFYFVIAILTAIDCEIYIFLAKWYKGINLENSSIEKEEGNHSEDIKEEERNQSEEQRETVLTISNTLVN
ncbi:hypothetical protein MKX01_037856, partial [Papaver californicum]